MGGNVSKDVFSTLRVYLSKITEGEHTPAEVVASMNAWLRESGEAIKLKVEEEVEAAVSKMGFVKQEEFDKLKKDLDALRASLVTSKSSAPKKATEKKSAVKKVVKKSAPRKVASAKKSAAGSKK
jgi:BMFP domain-containing protein YqiC